MLILVAAIILFTAYCAYEIGYIRGTKEGWNLCKKAVDRSLDDIEAKYGVSIKLTERGQDEQ